jgi:hypothetical protein
MKFYVIELRKRQRSVFVDILCAECKEKAPDLQQPLSDREKARGYEYRIAVYNGTHECDDCGRKPEKGVA